jgi:glutathione S-transferase
MTTIGTLHWSPKSPYVRKVMVVAHELGLDSRLHLQRSVAAMAQPNPSIMQHNPLSKIPTLVLPDGSNLFDSLVICEYLHQIASDESGGACLNLFPSNEHKWAALRWHAFGNGLLDTLILWRNERERASPLPALLQAFELKTQQSLNLLNTEAAAIEQAPYSIGSITLGCALGYLDYRFAHLNWRQSLPDLAAWFALLSQREAFVQTLPLDG